MPCNTATQAISANMGMENNKRRDTGTSVYKLENLGAFVARLTNLVNLLFRNSARAITHKTHTFMERRLGNSELELLADKPH